MNIRSLLPVSVVTIILFGLSPLYSFASDPAAVRIRRGPKTEPANPAVQAASPAAIPDAEPRQATPLPPLPEGVEQLSFEDFYKTPVGPMGLEVTDRLKSLDGKRVRVGGYMVKEETNCGVTNCVHPGMPSVKGRLILTPYPSAVSMAHYGLAEDLPVQAVYATIAGREDGYLPFVEKPMLLTGVLSIGNKEEADGRISFVRLSVDPADPSATPPDQASRAQQRKAELRRRMANDPAFAETVLKQ